jgi:hypothetical protein
MMELPPPCGKCGKPILFMPFRIHQVDGQYATFHDACAPRRQFRINQEEEKTR